MAIQLNNGCVVTVNGVDLSDHVTAVTINQSFEELDVTKMGDTSRVYTKGLESGSVSISFLNDYANGEVAATLQSRWGLVTDVKVKPNNATVSATNPEYQMQVLVNNLTPVAGDVGSISTQDVTWNFVYPMVVDTTP